MTEHERIAGLAEQIELAQTYLSQWPEWLRSSAHFAGTNHIDPEAVGSDKRVADNQAQTED